MYFYIRSLSFLLKHYPPVSDTNKRVKAEEDLINGINQAGVKVTADAARLRDTIKTLEATCEKCEEDKSTKDFFLQPCFLEHWLGLELCWTLPENRWVFCLVLPSSE